VLDKDFHRIKKTMARCLALRCPACGQSSIVERPFHIKHHCDSCRALFKREEGFFVGAILMNVVTTELIILAVCFFWLLVIGSEYETVLFGLFGLAVLFPILFFHHSWSFWLGFDYLVESLPTHRN
jgi:uncharacterized protein (DUF983 family)